jgi:hypothetical protein
MAPADAPIPLLSQVVNQLAPLVVTLLGALGSWVLLELKKRITNARALDVINKVSSLAETVVLDLEQTVIGALREAAADGVISAADAENAKMIALAKVKAYLGPKGKREALAAFGFADDADLDAFINSHIEAAVAKAKAMIGRKLAAVASSLDNPDLTPTDS